MRERFVYERRRYATMDNGENEAWFGNLKLQELRCLWAET